MLVFKDSIARCPPVCFVSGLRIELVTRLNRAFEKDNTISPTSYCKQFFGGYLIVIALAVLLGVAVRLHRLHYLCVI